MTDDVRARLQELHDLMTSLAEEHDPADAELRTPAEGRVEIRLAFDLTPDQ